MRICENERNLQNASLLELGDYLIDRSNLTRSKRVSIHRLVTQEIAKTHLCTTFTRWRSDDIDSFQPRSEISSDILRLDFLEWLLLGLRK